MSYPNKEGTVQEGRDAFEAGVKVGDNPHGEHSKAHWDWMQGFGEAGLTKLKNNHNNNKRRAHVKRTNY